MQFGDDIRAADAVCAAPRSHLRVRAFHRASVPLQVRRRRRQVQPEAAHQLLHDETGNENAQRVHRDALSTHVRHARVQPPRPARVRARVRTVLRRSEATRRHGGSGRLRATLADRFVRQLPAAACTAGVRCRVGHATVARCWRRAVEPGGGGVSLRLVTAQQHARAVRVPRCAPLRAAVGRPTRRRHRVPARRRAPRGAARRGGVPQRRLPRRRHPLRLPRHHQARPTRCRRRCRRRRRLPDGATDPAAARLRSVHARDGTAGRGAAR